MGKYLIQASYSTEGIKGVMEEGGSKRVAEVRKVSQALGGSLESLYFAFGKHDVIIIVDLPDHASAVAASMMAQSAGTGNVTITVLLTPEEVDAAAEKTVPYRPPGQ